MYNILTPCIQLANANLLALSSLFQPPGEEPGNLAEFWRSSLASQMYLMHESTREVLAALAQSRTLMSGCADKFSRRAEDVASQLAHTAVRSVAIATQVRREKCDRRVFPLPLPGGARAVDDRRQQRPFIVRQAEA